MAVDPANLNPFLQAPEGGFILMMRLYWPKKTPPSILPPGEGTGQPPAVAQLK